MDETTRLVTGLAFIFLCVLAILWFLLPFAIFGTKDLLERLIAENIKTRESIDKLAELLNPKDSK